MTVIETETMNAVKSAARAIVSHIDAKRNSANPDWEQRRYELVKEFIVTTAVNCTNRGEEISDEQMRDVVIPNSIALADEVIRQLKEADEKEK